MPFPFPEQPLRRLGGIPESLPRGLGFEFLESLRLCVYLKDSPVAP